MGTTKINGIPVYRATLSSDKCGMTKISLVDAPAVQADFLAFAAAQQQGQEQQQPQVMRYAVQDEERQLVYGVIMRADYPIYRYSKQTGAYYIMFTADTIREMAEKYLNEGRQNEVNLQHEEGSDVDGVQLVQWFIKDTARGVAPAGFEDIEDGSLFGEFHVQNADVWQGVKDGTYKGFSLEGIFGREAVDAVVSTEKMQEEAATTTKQTNMDKIMQIVMGAIKNALEGTQDSNEFKSAVAAAGQAGGAPEKEPVATFGSVSTDKGVIRWDGDKALAVGDRVEMVAEDGSQSAAADGSYETESHTIVVSAGAVTSITDRQLNAAAQQQEGAEGAEQHEAQEHQHQEQQPEEGKKHGFAAVAERFAKSFDEILSEKMRAIYDAFADAGLDAWVIEAGETFAVAEIWNGREWKIYRYALTFAEDGSVTLGDAVEVFPAYVTAEEKAESESKYAEQTARITELEAEVAKLRKEPVNKAAHEQFREIAGASEAKDRVAAILDAK